MATVAFVSARFNRHTRCYFWLLTTRLSDPGRRHIPCS
jgi:hypothetical protein